jgi:L-fuculose-phosphate aldolase
MILEQERNMIVAYGKKLVTHGLTKGTGGNISIYNQEEGLMAISPSGMDYFTTSVKDIVVLDLEGNKIDGNGSPSSEYDMHRICYQKRENICAVVHTHSTYCAILAALNWSIEPVHYLIGYAGRNVRCAPYRIFGSEELAQVALEYIQDRYAVLLANHGLLAIGDSIEYAFNTAEEIEFVAQIYYKAKCAGNPVLLSSDEMDDFLKKFKAYGKKK